MPLAGRAFLALWNDIAPAREAEYDRWHTREHVPERVGVPGFRGARRYVHRARATHRYFTLYELDRLAVLDSAAYRALVEHPTPWSASMRPDFANFLRVPCTTTASLGAGIGAAVGVLCHRRTEGDIGATLAALMEWPGVVACHAGDGGAAPLGWAAAPAGAAGPRPFDHVLLVEALDRVAAREALAMARDRLRTGALPDDFGNDVYDLAFAFPGHDADAPARHARRG
ncbi:MAG: hypothetical protein U1F10_06100 [Burkholderiales bacterium]